MDAWRPRQRGGEGNAWTELADQPPVEKIDEERIIPEERRSEKGARKVRGPEEMLRTVGRVERDRKDAPPVGADGSAIGCHKI